MPEVTWNKQSLSHAVNSRADQGKLATTDFIMPNEISDDMLVEWQRFYNENNSNPFVIEHEYARLHHVILADSKVPADSK